jgi:hypothetical protein
MAAYRAFGLAYGWEVLGLYQDLSQRYPVAPLLGARSAQAELALTGQWDGWSAVVASVLVRPPARSDGRQHGDTIGAADDAGHRPFLAAVLGCRR